MSGYKYLAEGGFLLTMGRSSYFYEQRLENVVWQNVVGCTATGNNLAKTAASGWGNAGASSVQTIAANGYMELTASEATRSRMIGLSNGDANQTYQEIDFAVYLNGSGELFAYESGSNKGQVGTYVAGDKVRVAVNDGVVTYWQNGNLLYTSQSTPTLPLLVDTALYTALVTIRSVVICNL